MMHNPPHPGRLIARRTLPALGVDARELARRMGMDAAKVAAVADQQAPITEEVAQGLQRAGIGNAEHWLRIQANYDAGIRRGDDAIL